MAEKETRRRRRKRDVRRDDSEVQNIVHKPELRDSDVDVEDEELVLPSVHEPSKVAQAVFLLLFLALLIIMGSLFITLRGTKVSGGLDLNSADDIDFHLADDIDFHPADDIDFHPAEDIGLHPAEDIDILQVADMVVPESDERGTTVAEGEDYSKGVEVHESSETIEPEYLNENFEENFFEEYLSVGESNDTLQYEDDVDDSQNDESNSPVELLVSDFIITTNSEEDEEPEVHVADNNNDVDSSENLETFVEELYEKVDITNEEDYEIKETLDNIDVVLEDENLIDDDENEDEYNFWEF